MLKQPIRNLQIVIDSTHHRKNPNFKLEIGCGLPHNVKTTRPCNKLDYQRLGPYLITKQINEVPFQLDLPPYICLHPVFHVSRLEPYASNSIPYRVVPPPPPIELDEGPEYEVKAILDSKVVKNKLYYFVDWLGVERQAQH